LDIGSIRKEPFICQGKRHYKIWYLYGVNPEDVYEKYLLIGNRGPGSE